MWGAADDQPHLGPPPAVTALEHAVRRGPAPRRLASLRDFWQKPLCFPLWPHSVKLFSLTFCQAIWLSTGNLCMAAKVVPSKGC